MGDYVSIDTVVSRISKSAGCVLTQVPGKKIMFHGKHRNGNSIILCTPQAKLQPKGFCWTDITSVQYNLLNSYDRATVVFRLEGNRLTRCSWSALKWYLTKNCMKNNAKEGDHWKLYIYSDYIQVVGNSEKIPLIPVDDIYDWN